MQVTLLFSRDPVVSWGPLWGVGDFRSFGERLRTPTWLVGSVLAFTLFISVCFFYLIILDLYYGMGEVMHCII